MVQVTRMRLVLAAICGGLLTAVVVGTGAAGAEPPADPPGNNGTIKVDGAPFDITPGNEPHVDCKFDIDFYGYDEGGDLFADVTFTAHPPSNPSGVVLDVEPKTVFIGEDSNDGGGSEAGHDASQEYDLSDALASIEPHPVQGWHVKLTIHADGSQGADTKFKVFWVTGCETTPPTTEPPGSTTTVPDSSTTTVPGSTPTTTPDDDEPGGPDDTPEPVPAPPAATPSVRAPDFAG